MGGAREGQFSSGQPYLRLGQGPALLMATGLSPENANPAGLMRRAVVGPLAPLARHFTVYLTSRAPGLPAGCTMSDRAGQYASAIERDLDGPALVHGTS